MSKLDSVHQELEDMAADLIAKRVYRLKRRKFVLFKWLRIKWLIRKVKFAKYQ